MSEVVDKVELSEQLRNLLSELIGMGKRPVVPTIDDWLFSLDPTMSVGYALATFHDAREDAINKLGEYRKIEDQIATIRHQLTSERYDHLVIRLHRRNGKVYEFSYRATNAQLYKAIV